LRSTTTASNQRKYLIERARQKGNKKLFYVFGDPSEKFFEKIIKNFNFLRTKKVEKKIPQNGNK
jgi:hypothetical protein